MNRPTLLLIEDNPFNSELFADLLTNSGISVRIACTAEQGIRLAMTELPDLILMDISLPGLDGLAATRLLKKEKATAQIPIVALTAHAMPGDKEKALAAGCAAYLTKPINTREFAEKVISLLPASWHGLGPSPPA
jgi:CheY-like chemotaxis protein